MSKQKKIVLVIVMLGSLALISGVMLAQGNYDIIRHVVAGGGSRVTGTTYGVISTMGQGAVGSFGSSANYGACAGFWCGGEAEFKIFLPLVLRSS